MSFYHSINEYNQISDFFLQRTWQFLKKNKDLLLIPVIYGLAEVCVLGILTLILVYFIWPYFIWHISLLLHEKSLPLIVTLWLIIIIFYYSFLSLINDMTNATIIYIVTQRTKGKHASIYEGLRHVLPKKFDLYIYRVSNVFALRNLYYRQPATQRDSDNYSYILSSWINYRYNYIGYDLFAIKKMICENKSPSQAFYETRELYSYEYIKINTIPARLSWLLLNIRFSFASAFFIPFVVLKFYPNIHIENFLYFLIFYIVAYYLLYKCITLITKPLSSIEWCVIYDCLVNKKIPHNFFSREEGKIISNFIQQPPD